MVPELISRLRSRFVFVVGKGGVGKSTTSSALALALADGGERTQLLSTDPAHSLRDLLGAPDATGASWTSECTPLLTVEELDADRRASEWLRAMRDPVGDLVELGTYLDRGDLDALFDGAFPGMDEVMAALRIAELASDGPERVVVDTAPTGHTLRLLTADRPLAGWVLAVEAMTAKASAVGVALTGHRLHHECDELFGRLKGEIDRFGEILRSADFVAVTRDDDVVAAETTRLVERLRADGLRVAATVVVLAEGASADSRPSSDTVHVGWRDDLLGCSGLRQWGDVQPRAGGTPARRPEGLRAGAVELLPPRSIMLFSGKGGVGKTTCAAAYATALARKHRRVLLLSTDPAGSLGDVFGRPVGATDTAVGPYLTARQLDAEAAFRRFRESHRERVGAVFERLGLRDSVTLDRRVLESLVDITPPGLDEIFAVQAILEDSEGRDVLILDTAPTGHFLRLLEMPRIALDWARALLRILLKYRAVLGLDDFAEDVLQFAKSVRALIELLANPNQSGVVIVTLGHALAVRETDRLASTIRHRGLPVSAVIINAWTTRTDATATDLTASAGAPTTIVSPRVSPPPIGTERLLELATEWQAA